MKTQENETTLVDRIDQSESKAQKSIQTFKMSLCVESDDALEDSEDQNKPPEDQMDESLTHENVVTAENTQFLYASRNSIFSRYSEMSFRKFKEEYQFIFVLITFLMFFISGLFFGAILVNLFLCDKGHFDLKDLNGTITLSEQFDMILW